MEGLKLLWVTMTTHRLQGWLVVAMVISGAGASSQRKVVDPSTCLCTVMNKTCEVREIRNGDDSFNRTNSHPGPPRGSSAMVKPYSKDEGEGFSWVFSWMAPEGSGLGATTGFFIDLQRVFYQRLYIPVSVHDLPSSDPDPDKVKWRVECKGDLISDDIMVFIGVLPLPPSGRKTQEISVTIPKSQSMKQNDPVHWQPAITKTKYRHAFVIQFPVPEHLGIKSFNFKLNNKVLGEKSVENGMLRKEIPVEKGECFTDCCIVQMQKLCYISPSCGGSPLFCGERCGRPRRISLNFSLGEEDACNPNYTAPQTSTSPTLPKFAKVWPDTTEVEPTGVSGYISQNPSSSESSYAMIVAVVTVTILLIISIMLFAFICRNRQRVKGSFL